MAKKTESGDTRGMEDTLAALNINKDLPPGDVAGAAGEAASTVEVDTVEEGYSEEEEVGDLEAPESILREDDNVVRGDDNVIVVPPAAAVQLPDPEPPALIPPPKPTKPKARATGKSKMGKGLADKLPGAEKIKVFKRKKDGKVWFIAEYTRDDLSGHTDFESFLTDYVKDQYGPGEYILKGVDSLNRESEEGVVRLEGPPVAEGTGGMVGMMQTLLTQSTQQSAEYLKRMEVAMQPTPQQDPLTMMAGLMDMQERLTGKAGAGEAAAKEAAAKLDAAAKAETVTNNQAMMEMAKSSSDSTMQMMMIMQQQQASASDRQMQMMMAMFNQPKEEDPFMKLFMAKMMKEDDAPAAALPPPPPPPPPAGPNMVEMITAIAGLLGNMSGGDSDDGFKEFLIAQQTKSQADSLTTKDILSLLTAQRGDSDGGFKSSVDNIAALMNVAQNMNRQNEGGPAAGIFDALAALFSNRDFAGSIANTIRAKTDQGKSVEANTLQMAQQQLALRQRLMQKTQQQQAILSQQAAAQAASLGVTPPGAGAPPLVTSPAEVPLVAPPDTPPTAPPTTVIPDAQARHADAIGQQKGMPPLPSDTHTHINNIAQAADDGERVGRTVTMLIYFAEFDDWRVFVEKLLGFIRDGNLGGTLEFLTALLSSFHEINLIDPTLAKEILRSVQQHFDALQQNLQEFEMEGDKEITGESLMGVEGQPVTPPEGDGEPVEEAGEEGGEEDVDPGEEDVDPGEEDGDPEPG